MHFHALTIVKGKQMYKYSSTYSTSKHNCTCMEHAHIQLLEEHQGLLTSESNYKKMQCNDTLTVNTSIQNAQYHQCLKEI